MENPVIARQSELLNRVVIERTTMQEMGRVERLWMYPQAHRVMGVICRSGRFRGKRWVYKLPQIEALSNNNLWVNGQPTETTEEQIQQLESLMDHEVWVDGGDRMGVITDCMFNRKTGLITNYLFVRNSLGRFVGSPLPLAPAELKGFGNHRVLVDERALERLQRERPNLRETWSQVREQAQEEYSQVTEEMRMAQQQAAERAEVLKQQAIEQAQTWQQRLGKKAQVWGKKLGQQAQELGDQAMELSQEWRQELQEQTRDWREQAGELRAGEWGEVPRVYAPDEPTWADGTAWEDETERYPTDDSSWQRERDGSSPAPSSRAKSPRHSQRPLDLQPPRVDRPSSPQDLARSTGDSTDAEDRWVSRENPWGYQSDDQSDEQSAESDVADQTTPPKPTTRPSTPPPNYLDPDTLRQFSGDEMDDDDPWV